jgi:hypothetical protein
MRDRNLPDRRDLDDRMAANIGEWKNPDSPDRPPSGNGGPGVGPPGANGGGTSADGGGGGAGGGVSEGPEVSSGSGPTTPPGKAGPPGNSPEAESIVDGIARRTTSDGARSLQEEQVGALAEYEDHFPRSVASQSSTPLGELLAHYRVAADAPAFTRVAEMNVARASSFTMLRGFSKVGGVLIGREPKGTADIRDIRWTITGRDVNIALVDAAGKEFWFGPFDTSLVHQALAYAADGRPVAVTMTIARPVAGLKIFLHPALIDTPLGCRVQQLDRLVDTYAGDKKQLPERGEITEQYLGQVAVYNAALAKRMEAVSEKLSPDSDWKPAARQMAADYASEAEKGLHEPNLFSESSIMRRKPEFFEPALLKTMKSCRKDNLDAFEVCVLDTYRASRFVREFKKDYLRTWSYEAATIEPWSGVRERDYQVSNNLDFLKAPTGMTVADRLWPFDFMVQIAFTSPAVNLSEKQQQEVYVDREPVEFTEIQNKIEQLVDDGIHRDHFDAQFKDLRDFAVLQRLFRAALDGNLGDKFPALKLAQLTNKTADSTPYFHTRRWNSSSRTAFDHWARQAYLVNDGQRWMQEAREKLPLCANSVSAVYEGKGPSNLTSACNFAEYNQRAAEACPDPGQNSAACSWRKFMILAHREVTEAAFGVMDDERQSSPTAECPPLASSDVASERR